MDAELSKDLSNEELRLLGEAIDSSPSPLTLYDTNYQIIYANATSRSLWPELHSELSKGVGLEIAAREAAKVLFPGAPEDVIKAATDYVIYTFHSSEPNEMKANDDRWIKLTHHQIGERAVAGIGVDITGLKNNEKQLQQAKRAQENLIEVLEYGLLVVDDDGIITTFNPAYQAYCNSFGFEVSQGMHVKDLTRNFIKSEKLDIGKIDFETWFAKFYETRFGTHDTIKEEFSLSDGRHILRHQSYRKLVGNIVTITDITEIKKAQLKAEFAEKSKSEFLANMSHEIRTPMNGVMGMAQLLARCDLGDKERNFVSIIQRSSEALLTIINDILDFSKIEAQHVELETAPFSLSDCVEDVIALLSMAAAEKNVELIFHMQPDLPELYMGDIGRMRQIITNIFGNAVKFTHEGHVFISVEGEQTGDSAELVIKIEDTGIGIPQSKIGDIFDKFQQADGSTTREYEGAGLGLSIAKQLTKLMGGDIWAKSEVDKGSSFEIQLSLPIAPEQQISDINRSAFPSSRILIIDDSPLHCQILKEQFSYWNCRSAAVTSAHKGLMALEIAQKRNIKFDLILLDYQFANPRAEDFIEKIRDHSELHNIPVILFTSVTESGLIQHEQFNDRIEFVTKPYNKASLFRAANNLLNRTQSVENNIITLEPLRSIDLDIQMPNSQTQNPTVIDILVAEDNEVNRLYIQYVLDELNVSYKIVEDGQKAARHFLKVSPRLVLMDISMPVLNGYQSTRLIRDIEKRHALQRTPIIAVTAHAMQGSEETCLKADMDGYLSKPLSIETLRQILVKWDILTPEGKEKSALG